MVKTLLRIAVIGALAIALGFTAAIGVAALGHEILAASLGQEGIVAIDDSPLMFTFVAASYATWVIVAIVVFVLGWRRFGRSRG